MNENQLRSMLKELTVEPYSFCEMTYTISNGKGTVAKVYLDKNTKEFQITNGELGKTKGIGNLEETITFIQSIIHKS